MATYLALIRKEDGTSYGVDFPDFPGLISAGDTLEQALHSAQEALAFHIEGMLEEGLEIPEPTGLDVVMRDKHNRAATAVLIQGPAVKGKAVRVNITIEENLLKLIDEVAASKGMGRSGFIAEASRASLGGTLSHGSALVEKAKDHVGRSRRRGKRA